MWADMQSQVEAVPLSQYPQFSPTSGEIYLTRIVNLNSAGGVQDYLYSKINFVVVSNDTVIIRWSNLYDVGSSYCSQSADTVTMDTNAVWSNYYGPDLYDDTWIGALFIIFFIVLAIVGIACLFVMMWACRSPRQAQAAQNVPLQVAPQRPASPAGVYPPPENAPVYQEPSATPTRSATSATNNNNASEVIDFD